MIPLTLGQDDCDFYVSLVGPHACSILDLGCGTCMLCCCLAGRGHRVTGVDPAAAMLVVAKRKRHAEKIEWVESIAQSYRSQRRFDLIFMTGHAFQTLLTDADALATLGTMRAHIKDRGRIVFETRNPNVKSDSFMKDSIPCIGLRSAGLACCSQMLYARFLRVTGRNLRF